MLSGPDKSARRILALTISSDMLLSSFIALSSIGPSSEAFSTLRRWDARAWEGTDILGVARPAPAIAVSTNARRDMAVRPRDRAQSPPLPSLLPGIALSPC